MFVFTTKSLSYFVFIIQSYCIYCCWLLLFNY